MTARAVPSVDELQDLVAQLRALPHEVMIAVIAATITDGELVLPEPESETHDD